MIDTSDLIDLQALEKIADDAGLAIALVDNEARQIAAINNNSICQQLNPSTGFSPACSQFCGRAFDEASEAGGRVAYECHAGLECRAVVVRDPKQSLVVIVGRTFVKAENYRKATARAVSGDWRHYPPAEFFENVLLTGSPGTLNKAAGQLDALIAEAPARQQKELTEAVELPTKRKPATTKAEGDTTEVSQPSTIPAQNPENRHAEAKAWRSFFGSILKTDYHEATNAILSFLAHQYGFSSLVWLERRGDRFVNTVTIGEMKNRKVRLGISPDDERMVEALHNEMPLELGERPDSPEADSNRTMYMFPIGIDNQVSAAIATLDPINDEAVKKQIVRICHSIAPQLEILRLRNEVAHGETLSTAVRRFSESLKRIDADDLWLNLTQNAAEMLRAERASLLIYDEKSETLAIKAIVGATAVPDSGDVGGRVAKIVFEKNENVAVLDVSRTGLPPAPQDRRYKTKSFLSCPISISGRRIGVINFTDRASGEAFDRNSLELFQAIAPQLAVAIDRAMLKERAGEFEQLSVTDALTGLLNRRYIEERLAEEIKRSNRHGFPMSFMMLDVDEFKSYNDQFGHPAGDEALKQVANVIRETLRGADVAARFGGEEFSILLPQTTGEEAAAIAERIRINIEETDFSHRRVTISIGIASGSAELCSSADIVSAADKALYEAKRLGRNRVQTFGAMANGSANNTAK